MTLRVGLIGGECTGKSSLAADLSDSIGALVVPEFVRAFVVEHGRPPRQSEQPEVMQGQIDWEEGTALASPTWLVADPAPLMTAVYSVVYFGDHALLPAAVEHARGYHCMLWCTPDIPWVADAGMRDGERFRQAEHEVIAELVIERLVAAGIPVTQVSGAPMERRAMARHALGLAAT